MLVRRLSPMMLAIVVGTLAGSGIIAGKAAPAASKGLGITLFLYGFFDPLKPQFRIPPAIEPWAGPLVGAVTGLVTGATGVFVIPAVPYLGSLRVDRDDLVQALGLSFTVSTHALAAGLALHSAPTKGTGQWRRSWSGTSSVPAVPPRLGCESASQRSGSAVYQVVAGRVEGQGLR